MKNVYGYIRVSTVKQGTGVSLQEQKEAIIRYAEKHNLNITEWFEEQETAAKQGRPLFNKMMKLVKSGKATGVIIHKIDRSARNLKDWASLGDLIDQGYEIHFAHESLDMKGRGGRLAADIQAVIASDYIRNLREEAMKGLYGRLKQGIYPFMAPAGYLDTGRGNIKAIDPVKSPLVKKAFQLYATGKYNLNELVEIMKEFGLKNSIGQDITYQGLSKILNNPFYTGVMKVKGKTFQGNHVPLISPKLFFDVQNILKGKTNTKSNKHNFLFRRLLKCEGCNYSLIGEIAKGHIYYRCHTKECPTKCVREDMIEKMLLKSMEDVQLHPVESNLLNELLMEAQINYSQDSKSIEDSLRLSRSQISIKLDRLADAFIEGMIDKVQFEEKKEKCLIEIQLLNKKSDQFSNHREIIFRKTRNFLELIKSLKNSYINSIIDDKRRIIKLFTSNLQVHGKKLMITMNLPFNDIANRFNNSSCAHERGIPRTCTVDNDKINNFSQELVYTPELRARMKELLDIIMGFFELQVENDQDNEEKLLYDEMFNSSTEHTL
ncbi:MAG: recombinase family protein [Saprospiraceae bacterium]|nr:recombinase family protein [Saprospiraceae bacterium]MBP8892556.1 recombinase family protein [Saprospiraceae bacterium]MBP9209889.1 recombinase family protein [Saprospiraceae bacterium]MBV6472716.1 hypothetical protein [Saprospiraceae bacterium]